MPRAENAFAYRIEIDPSRVQAVERLAQATERLGAPPWPNPRPWCAYTTLMGG